MNKAQGVIEAKDAVDMLVRYGLADVSNPNLPRLTFRGKQALADLLNEPHCKAWVGQKMTAFQTNGMTHDEAAIATMAVALIADKYSDWGQAS